MLSQSRTPIQMNRFIIIIPYLKTIDKNNENVLADIHLKHLPTLMQLHHNNNASSFGFTTVL